MKRKNRILILILSCIGIACTNEVVTQKDSWVYTPKNYVVHSTLGPINIDGKADEDSWVKAEFTDTFEDIEGDLKPKPTHSTKVKMLWDHEFLYIYAEMVEPHVWGKLTQRDTVVYFDDDFEVFIDPDGDTHHYTEIEVNALNTVWDLMLMRPYSIDKNEKVLWKWDIPKLKTAVSIDGTINDPTDIDKGWSVELAIPMETLLEFSGKKDDQNKEPKDGDTWRINFSRVDWKVDILNGEYIKSIGENSKPLPENNWVWSPQGVVAMHIPERWGYLQFTNQKVGHGEVQFTIPKDEALKIALRDSYRKIVDYKKKNGTFPSDINFQSDSDALGLECKFNPRYEATSRQFTIEAKSCDGSSTYIINQEGKLWRE